MRRAALIALLLSPTFAACGDDAAPDGGVPVDTGVRDAGRRDLGVRPDAATVDAGSADTGPADSGPGVDAELEDVGLEDSGFEDSGFEDAGPADTGPSCSDGIRNQDETWVDCGGWCNNLCPACPNTGNLIRNPSFENVNTMSTGQGLLPNDWIIIEGTPDTFSNDGSFGLPPSGFGNFTDVVARDGIRWVAGWTQANETFGQVSSSTLTAGAHYRLEGYLHRAMRSDLQAHGTYVVYLADGPARTVTAELGHFPITSSVAWQFRRFEFVAPPEAAQLPLLYFVPTSTLGGSYPGLDDVMLIQTSSCAP